MSGGIEGPHSEVRPTDHLTASHNDPNTSRSGEDLLARPEIARSGTSEDIAWLRRRLAGGACLTWGIPGLDVATNTSWVGDRLAWWPQGIPSGQRIGLVSSRLGRRLDQQPAWFAALRTASANLRPDQLLVTSASTTTHRFLLRCAVLFGVRLLCLGVPAKNLSLSVWLKKIQSLPSPASPDLHAVHLSPVLTRRAPQPHSEIGDVPLRDRAVIASCDQVQALHVRRNGQLDRLLRQRLSHRCWPTGSTLVVIGTDLVDGDLADQLMRCGAIGWYVYGAGTVQPRATQSKETRKTKPAPIIPPPQDLNWPFLSHCTRRPDGPWPDEQEDDYLDQLILAPSASDRSPWAALYRIVKNRRLRAASTAIRGGTSVVSFTAIPLRQLHRMRVYRFHRVRWDFEPYGICLQRDWLVAQGARPVLYGDQALWEHLSDHERPFFQVRQTMGRDKRRTIDWTAEREWRHLGDVDLSRIPQEAALVFVPDQAEAEALAAVSPWPITVLKA